jgi:hypothetical protein
MPKVIEKCSFREISQVAVLCDKICDMKNLFNLIQITAGKKRGEVLKEKKRGEGRRHERRAIQLNFRDLSCSGLISARRT